MCYTRKPKFCLLIFSILRFPLFLLSPTTTHIRIERTFQLVPPLIDFKSSDLDDLPPIAPKICAPESVPFYVTSSVFLRLRLTGTTSWFLLVLTFLIRLTRVSLLKHLLFWKPSDSSFVFITQLSLTRRTIEWLPTCILTSSLSKFFTGFRLSPGDCIR